MIELGEDVPVCPECQADLCFVGVEDLAFDDESQPFDVWRCKQCPEKDTMQLDYHYPQGMFVALRD